MEPNSFQFAILGGLSRLGKHVYRGTADSSAVESRRAGRKARRSTLQSQRKASK